MNSSSPAGCRLWRPVQGVPRPPLSRKVLDVMPHRDALELRLFVSPVVSCMRGRPGTSIPISDVTELKKAEASTANVSHELKTLTSIKGWFYYAGLQVASPEDQQAITMIGVEVDGSSTSSTTFSSSPSWSRSPSPARSA